MSSPRARPSRRLAGVLAPPAALLLVLAGCSAAPAPAASTATAAAEVAAPTDAEVRELFDEWNAALATGDPAQVDALYADDAVLLPTDFKAYRHYSNLFKAAVAEIAPEMEDRGIDEIYLDLSNHDEDTETLEFRVNQDFLLDGAAAREFRAISMMYKDGQLPVEVFYEYFLKAEVIPEYGPAPARSRSWLMALAPTRSRCCRSAVSGCAL